MWFFGGKDKKKDVKAVAAKAPAQPMTSKQIKTEALMAQMRTLRAEIGEENLQKLAQKLRLEDLKKQVRSDIDNDPLKRERLIDEIRWQMYTDHGSDTRH